MVEDVEELSLQSQFHMLGQRKRLCEIEVVPEEVRTAQGVAAEVSKLAVLRAIVAIALSRARIDGRRKRVWI